MEDISLKKLIVNIPNDNKSFEEIYLRYKDEIFLFILGIVKNYESAQDITQDVFIRIKKYCKSYNSLKNPKTWIYTIAKNTCYTYLKENNVEIPSDVSQFSSILDRYNIVENNEKIIIEQYLADLSDEERSIVILHVFGGLKHYEIAKVLKMTHMQVRSKYSYALKKLKKKVGELYE